MGPVSARERTRGKPRARVVASARPGAATGGQTARTASRTAQGPALVGQGARGTEQAIFLARQGGSAEESHRHGVAAPSSARGSPSRPASAGARERGAAHPSATARSSPSVSPGAARSSPSVTQHSPGISSAERDVGPAARRRRPPLSPAFIAAHNLNLGKAVEEPAAPAPPLSLGADSDPNEWQGGYGAAGWGAAPRPKTSPCPRPSPPQRGAAPNLPPPPP
jgi:hypothetical protein